MIGHRHLSDCTCTSCHVERELSRGSRVVAVEGHSPSGKRSWCVYVDGTMLRDKRGVGRTFYTSIGAINAGIKAVSETKR